MIGYLQSIARNGWPSATNKRQVSFATVKLRSPAPDNFFYSLLSAYGVCLVRFHYHPENISGRACDDRIAEGLRSGQSRTRKQPPAVRRVHSCPLALWRK